MLNGETQYADESCNLYPKNINDDYIIRRYIDRFVIQPHYVDLPAINKQNISRVES